MIDISNSTFFQSGEYPILIDGKQNSIVEGSPLVIKMDDGVGKVTIGTGVDAETFLGVAFAGYVRPTVVPMQETFTIDTTAAYTLARVSLGEPLVYIAGAFATISDVAPTAAGIVKYDSAANTLTFHADDNEKAAVVVYRYAASLAEARAFTGDGYPSGVNLAELAGTVGVMKQGTVYTDQYDLTVDWTAANIGTIKVNSEGLFSIGGTGATASNARVVSAPGFGSTYLGIELK